MASPDCTLKHRIVDSLKANRWLIAVCGTLAAGLLLLEYVNPELATDPTFNRNLGQICLYGLILTVMVRRTMRDSREREEVLRAEVARTKAEPIAASTQEAEVAWTRAVWTIIGVYAVKVVGALVTLYILVRFVKWAWTD